MVNEMFFSLLLFRGRANEVISEIRVPEVIVPFVNSNFSVIRRHPFQNPEKDLAVMSKKFSVPLPSLSPTISESNELSQTGRYSATDYESPSTRNATRQFQYRDHTSI